MTSCDMIPNGAGNLIFRFSLLPTQQAPGVFVCKQFAALAWHTEPFLSDELDDDCQLVLL